MKMFYFSWVKKSLNPMTEGHFYTDLFWEDTGLESKDSVNHCQPRPSIHQEESRTRQYGLSVLSFEI
jgi:hypothetical protein